jgi:hypothetical protein
MKRLFFFYSSLLTGFSAGSQSGSAREAVLDLKGKDFKKESIISLNVNWEFYNNALLTPADFKRSDGTVKPDTLIKPGSRNDIKLKGKEIGGEGFATYRLKIINVPKRQLVLDAYSIQTSCRIFINDSMAAEVGKPGTSKGTTLPMNRDVQLNIPFGPGEVQIIVQMANFHHRKGGFVHPFELGTQEAIGKQRLIYYILDFTESSALAIMGLFLFALYVFRRKDMAVLYFSLFCITLSFRPVISVNYLLSALFTGINWNLLLKIEYLAVLFPCFFMMLFIKKLFPDQLKNITVKILTGILLIKIFITIFFSPAVFSWLIPVLLVIIPLGVLIFTVTIIRAIIAKVEGAPFAGAGLVILLASLLLKVMVYAGIISPVHVLITILDIGFIFMMSLILGSRFSLQFSKVERLQKKTELQHEEILKQKLEVESQREILEEKNKDIIDSINYAKRIQTSLLPTEKYIERMLNHLMKRRDNSK